MQMKNVATSSIFTQSNMMTSSIFMPWFLIMAIDSSPPARPAHRNPHISGMPCGRNDRDTSGMSKSYLDNSPIYVPNTEAFQTIMNMAPQPKSREKTNAKAIT